MVFNIPSETSKEERKTIEGLQDVLISDKYVEDDREKKSAFDTFISTAICDSILHSQERDVSKKDSQEEQSL